MLFPWPRIGGAQYEDFTVTYNRSVNFVMPAGCTKVDLEGQGTFGQSDFVGAIQFLTVVAQTPGNTQGTSFPSSPYDGTSLDQIYNTMNGIITASNSVTTRREFASPIVIGRNVVSMNYGWPSNTPAPSDVPTVQGKAFFPYDTTNPAYVIHPGAVPQTWFSTDTNTWVLPYPSAGGSGFQIIGNIRLLAGYFPGPPTYKAWPGTGAMNWGNAPTNPASPSTTRWGLYFNDVSNSILVPRFTGDPPNISMPTDGGYGFGAAGGPVTGFGFTWNGSSYTPPSPGNSLANRGMATRPSIVTHSAVSVSPGTTYPISFSPLGTGGYVKVSGRKYKGAPVTA